MRLTQFSGNQKIPVSKTSSLLTMIHNQVVVLFGKPPISWQTVIRRHYKRSLSFPNFLVLYSPKTLDIWLKEKRLAIKRGNSSLFPITIVLD